MKRALCCLLLLGSLLFISAAWVVSFTIVNFTPRSGLTEYQVNEALQDAEGLTGLHIKHDFKVCIVTPDQMNCLYPGGYCGCFESASHTIFLASDALYRCVLRHEFAHAIFWDTFGDHPESWAEKVGSVGPTDW